jgi:hypothetical protein
MNLSGGRYEKVSGTLLSGELPWPVAHLGCLHFNGQLQLVATITELRPRWADQLATRTSEHEAKMATIRLAAISNYPLLQCQSVFGPLVFWLAAFDAS